MTSFETVQENMDLIREESPLDKSLSILIRIYFNLYSLLELLIKITMCVIQIEKE